MDITFADIQPFLRLIGAYIALHIILFFVEWYRFTHSNWSWYGFKNDGMLGITYVLVLLDGTIAVVALAMWCLRPILESTLART